MVVVGWVVIHLAPAVIAIAYIFDKGTPGGKRK
jgi:hypothetical protein